MARTWTFLGWCIPQEGQPFCPLTAEEIERLIVSGRLHPEEEVLKAWKDDYDRLHFFGSQACAARTAPSAEGPVRP